MSKTAEQLRIDITNIIIDAEENPSSEQAMKAINKVLDAADNAIESVDYEDSAAGNGAINNALDAINKLRPSQ